MIPKIPSAIARSNAQWRSKIANFMEYSVFHRYTWA